MDFSNLKKLTTSSIPPRFSKAYTMGFWAQFGNEQFILDNSINVILNNNFMISVGLDLHISALCSLHLKYQPELINLTSFSALKETKTKKNYSAKQTSFKEDMSKRWFHVKCSYNMDSSQQLIQLSSFGNGKLLDTIKQENTEINLYNYYDNVQLDIDFTDFSDTGITINKSSISQDSYFYLQNLVVFSDFIPENINFQYL